jgi:hypothetical protein
MMMEGVKDATLVTVMAMMSPTIAMDAAVVVLIVRTVFLDKGVMYRLVDSDVVTFLELSCMYIDGTVSTWYCYLNNYRMLDHPSPDDDSVYCCSDDLM